MLALSAAACFTLYTAVKIVVCCCGWDLNCIRTAVVIVVWCWCLLYVRVGLLVLLLLLLLLLPATLLVATVYCLLHVSEYGVLLLAIHIPERLAAACYLLGHS